MTYDARKVKTGQEIVSSVTMHLDACKYTTPQMLAARNITLAANTSIPESGAGAIITIEQGNALLFAFNSFLRLPGGEILGVEVDTATQITVTDRARFGTQSEALTGSAECQLMHKGDADGTCRGFPINCSSPEAFDGIAKHEITIADSPLEAEAEYTNGLLSESIRRTGPKTNQGINVGSRATLSFSAMDERDEIDIFNPYRLTDPGKIATAGQKYAKLIAGHPYFSGRKLVYREGLRDAGLFGTPDYIERTYIIDKVDLGGGEIKVSCLDPIILSEDKKAKMPKASTGQLSEAVTANGTSISYINAPEFAYGQNGRVAFVRIDSEVIKCQVSGPYTLTMTDRGYRTTAKEHSFGATVQECEVIAGEHAIDLIERAIRDYTQMPPEYMGDYTAAKEATPNAVFDEWIISTPTAVKDIINMAIKIGDYICFYGETTAKLVIDYIPEQEIQPVSFNDYDHFKGESVRVDRNEPNQFTRASVMWGPYDVTKNSAEYFEFRPTVINLLEETAQYLGGPNERKEEKIPALNNSVADSVLGVSYLNRVLSRAKELPYILYADVDAENIGSTQSGAVEAGKIIDVSTDSSSDDRGNPRTTLFQIEQINGTLRSGFSLVAKRYQLTNPNVDFAIETETYINYVLSDFFAPEEPGVYTVFFAPGAIFGSFETDKYSFDTGPQAEGVEMHFIIRASLLGQGGNGGDGFEGDGTAEITGNRRITYGYGKDGKPGGGAMNLRLNATIDTGSGLIWAGGGGDGAETASIHWENDTIANGKAGRGGNGGQGYSDSIPGKGGSVLIEEDGDGFPYEYEDYPGKPGNQSSAPSAKWGEPGRPTVSNWIKDDRTRISQPGAAGIAINTNGFSVEVVAGNNPINIKGRII